MPMLIQNANTQQALKMYQNAAPQRVGSANLTGSAQLQPVASTSVTISDAGRTAAGNPLASTSTNRVQDQQANQTAPLADLTYSLRSQAQNIPPVNSRATTEMLSRNTAAELQALLNQ